MDNIKEELQNIKYMYNYCYESSKKYKRYSDISSLILFLYQPLIIFIFYKYKICLPNKYLLPLNAVGTGIYTNLNYNERSIKYYNSAQDYYELYNNYKNNNSDITYEQLIKNKILISRSHLPIDNDIYDLTNSKL